MTELIYIIISALGVLLVGIGGTGWFLRRQAGQLKPIVLPPLPRPHTSVAPAKDVVAKADAEALDLDIAVGKLHERQVRIDKAEPVKQPSKEGVDFLKSIDPKRKP